MDSYPQQDPEQDPSEAPQRPPAPPAWTPAAPAPAWGAGYGPYGPYGGMPPPPAPPKRTNRLGVAALLVAVFVSSVLGGGVAARLRSTFVPTRTFSHSSIARLICSLSGMPSRSLIARRASRWPSSMKNV